MGKTVQFNAKYSDQLIEEATTDAYNETEQAGGFFAMIEENLALPLLKYDIVGLNESAAMMRLRVSAALGAEQPLRLRMQVRSFEAVCKLVQAGMGLGVLPELAARDFAPMMGLRLVR